MRRLVRVNAALLFAFASTTSLPRAFPQDPGASPNLPAYDVISVKPDKAETGRIMIRMQPDMFTAENVTVKMLIEDAYGIKQDLISGAPGWADSKSFDIQAKVAAADLEEVKKLKPEQRLAMLQTILTQRFGLKVHTEIKQLLVYELLPAKGGFKLKEANTGDTYANGIKGPDGVGRPGMMRMGPGQLVGQGITMEAFSNQLERQVHRTVIDKTGLTGKYDVALTWTRQEDSAPAFKAADASSPTPDDSAPSIFTALQEQLGLRLQSTKGPVKTLIVDNLHLPSED